MIYIKVVFIGCVESSRILLEKLIECDIEIVGVFTKKKSNFNSDFCDLSAICLKNNIKCYYVENINDDDCIKHIKEANPDLIYCFGWSQLLGEEIIDIPKVATVGFHPADLPMNRGRHPIIWALVLGLKKTASTFFIINKGADNGDIISKRIIDIDIDDDAQTLYNKIMENAVLQIEEFTEQFVQNNIVRSKQDEKRANYWRKRTKDDGRIDWRMSSESIYNLVRGLTKPYVGAHFNYNNKEYKVWKIQIIKGKENYNNIEYGKVIKKYLDGTFCVKTGDGIVKVLESDKVEINEGDYLL